LVLKNLRYNLELSGNLSYKVTTVAGSASAPGSSGTSNYPTASTFIDAIMADIISGSSPY